VRRIGLTGGIGAGKSTAGRAFAELGATVVDADAIAREVVEPGTPGLAAVAEAFPSVVVDGVLDRAALAAIVFADDGQRRTLEGITHPLVGAEVQRRAESVPADGLLVYDVPLLAETGAAPGFDLVLVVAAPLDVRLARLADRGLPERDARDRIAKQATDDQRRAIADVVLDNGGSPEALTAQARALYAHRLAPFAVNAAARRPADRGPVAIVDADPDWPRQAGLVAARLTRATGKPVDHVGSTAVPDLAAKDVLDLQLTVADMAEADALRAVLDDAGFPSRPEIRADTPHGPGDWSKRFHRNADPGRAVNVHVRAAGSPGRRAALTFRDWLRADAGVRAEYETAKRALAADHADIEAYADAKETWFAAAWPRMEAWAANG
jgi:dephospho-CoA kinase